MILNIRVFAGLAEQLGGPFVTLNTDKEQLTAGELKELLARQYPDAAGTIGVSFVAKNQAYAKTEEPVGEKDELALIPPVSGGTAVAEAAQEEEISSAMFNLTRGPINTGSVAEKVADPNHGASLLFVGTTREYTDGQRTLTLDYDAYQPMALSTMRQIGDEIAQRWPGVKCAITHRLGRVKVGETSVVIAVSAPHRAPCYEASQYAIERLKQIVPIWKKELWENGAEWKGQSSECWNPTALPPALASEGGEQA